MMNKDSNNQGFDFFSENETDFYHKFSTDSVLVQGRHKDQPPMVTIVLTTCKRPKLLNQALDSALNQSDFDDYQIIIADNEGEDIYIETETAKLVSRYCDDKILYYRHRTPVKYKMDSAARLAKSEWICFLHDDDLLASNHLAVMSQIVRTYKKIKFLSCEHRHFFDEISEDVFYMMTKPCANTTYQIKRYPKPYICLGYYTNWLGAFINRKAYISTGGMPTVANGIGDYCMVGKFHYRYGVYELKTNNPLYFYRSWNGQATAEGTSAWMRRYAAEYQYHVYVTNVYHRFFKGFWNRISAYRTLEKCKNMNASFYQTAIDLEEFSLKCNMQKGILDKGKQYERDMFLQILYEEMIKRLCFVIKYKEKI